MRSLIIGCALLVPVFFIVALSSKIKPAPDIYQNNKQVADIASKIKDAPIPEDTAPGDIKPGSLEEARMLAKKRLAELDDMTEEEWQKQRESRIEFNKKWLSLSHEQKLKAIEEMQKKKFRAPEIEGDPAEQRTD